MASANTVRTFFALFLSAHAILFRAASTDNRGNIVRDCLCPCIRACFPPNAGGKFWVGGSVWRSTGRRRGRHLVADTTTAAAGCCGGRAGTDGPTTARVAPPVDQLSASTNRHAPAPPCAAARRRRAAVSRAATRRTRAPVEVSRRCPVGVGPLTTAAALSHIQVQTCNIKYVND